MIATCPHENAPPVQVVVTDDESELVRRAREQDTRAFEQLYRRHVPRIYAVCLRLTADVHRAEESTQTAFIQAWRKLSSFRGESSFASWLHRLAVTTVLMDFRTTRRREARLLPVDDPSAFETATSPRPAGLRLDIEHAIAGLPAQARTVFVLHDIEGYTHEEIAHLMELQTGTPKAQLHRARQLLQETLQ